MFTRVRGGRVYRSYGVQCSEHGFKGSSIVGCLGKENVYKKYNIASLLEILRYKRI